MRTIAQPSTAVSQVDTNYVKDFSHLVAVRVYGSTKFNSLRLFGNDGRPIIYSPNNQYNIGVGISYRKLTLNLGFKAPFVNNDDQAYGRTRYFDAQANLLSPERATNLFLQFYQGYHISTHGTNALGWPSQETEHPYRPDIQQFNAGVTTLHVFNSERFSYRAAFNQDAWQRKSQGSWMLGWYAVYYGLRADSSLVPSALLSGYGTLASIRIGDYGDVGPMGGYAYTWVPKPHWFMTLSLAAGVGLSFQHVVADREGERTEISSMGPGWHLQGRAATGYNSRRFEVSATYNQERIQYMLPKQDVLAWGVGNARLSVVYRLKERITIIDKIVRKLKRDTPDPLENVVPATDQPTPRP